MLDVRASNMSQHAWYDLNPRNVCLISYCACLTFGPENKFPFFKKFFGNSMSVRSVTSTLAHCTESMTLLECCFFPDGLYSHHAPLYTSSIWTNSCNRLPNTVTLMTYNCTMHWQDLNITKCQITFSTLLRSYQWLHHVFTMYRMKIKYQFCLL